MMDKVIAALGGVTGIGAIVAAVIGFLKAKTTALNNKNEASAEHATMQETLDALTTNLTTAQNRAEVLEKSCAVKDRRIAALEKQLEAALKLTEAKGELA